MTCRLELPGRWIDSGALEQALLQCPDLHASGEPDVDVVFLHGAKVMIGAAVRLLSLFNQLDNATKRVRLRFEEGEAGAMGYLNRMGFFDHLSGRIEVFPERPADSGAETYGGTNPGLVEIARIDRERRDRGLPTSLAETLKRACSQRPDVDSLGGAAWTIFAELIDNVFSHSQTPLDGYAALQVYRKGSFVKAAVSDSGLGIMKTLRPALQQSAPRLAALSDVALLVEIFRQGVSRHGKDRGCGLKGCSEKAIKFKAKLDVRLPNSRVLLVPELDGSFQYRLLPTTLGEGLPNYYLYGVLEANLMHQDENRQNGVTDSNSGGTTLFLDPGIEYVTSRWVAAIAIQVPVVQNLNGAALRDRYVLQALLRANF